MKHQILIVHGGNAFNSYDEFIDDLKKKEVFLERFKTLDWKYNLGNELGEEFEVLNPKMPNFQNAKYTEWKIWFERIIPHLSNNIILIGHSLGGIFLTKYLSENTFPKNIISLILVAPPYNTAEIHPLADFLLGRDLNKINDQTDKIILYQSRDDKVVPFPNANHYLKALPKIELVIFDDRGHINQEHFPELISKIKSLV